MITLQRPTEDRERIARDILGALPSWFGRPESTARYVEIAGTSPMIAACRGETVVGFLTLIDGPEPATAEICVIGVLPAFHRQGVGRLLVKATVADCRSDGRRTLFVQTLGPSHPDPGYAKTRAFYRAVGFEEVRETKDAWGPGTPALLLRMSVA